MSSADDSFPVAQLLEEAAVRMPADAELSSCSLSIMSILMRS